MQLNILILVFPKDTCCHRKGESAPAMERTKKTEKKIQLDLWSEEASSGSGREEVISKTKSKKKL